MTSDQRRDRLRQALVDAAERCIAGEGLAGLKARRLAAEAGCAVGAIYTVFPDLAGLVMAVNSRTFAMLGEHLRAASDAAFALPVPVRRQAETALTELAAAYLDFAAGHTTRWRTLFDFRVPDGQDLPDWHLREQEALFAILERPLAVLQPELAAEKRALLARSLFSAAHGMVLLGLEGKVMSLPLPYLREQVKLVVAAMGRGLGEP